MLDEAEAGGKKGDFVPSPALFSRTERGNTRFSGGNGLVNALRRGGAGHIVAGQHGVEFERAVKVVGELGAELAKIFER